MAIIDSDVILGAGPGYEFSFDSEELRVAAGVRLAVQSGSAVTSQFAESVLRNFGTIASGENFAVVLAGTAEVYNGGLISGFGGIVGRGAGGRVVNDGTIIGSTGNGGTGGVDLGFNHGDFSIRNNGTVSGWAYGARIIIDGEGQGELVNFGTIAGGTGVILGRVGAGGRMFVDNTGTIEGDATGLSVSETSVFLRNRGDIRGDVMFSNAGDDLVRNRGGFIEGDVSLGGGNDVFDNRGGVVAGVISGGTGDDVLKGGKDADILAGGDGADVLKGRKGADHFLFDVPPEPPAAKGKPSGSVAFDTISDFSRSDTIELDHNGFPGLGPEGVLPAGRFYVGTRAHDRGDRIIYDSHTGALYYDPDGKKGAAAIQIAELPDGLKIAHADFLIAYDSPDQAPS